jgi:macrolide-specific efflux system membrane fusion protein
MKLKILAVVVLGAVGVGAAVYAMGGLSASAASATQYLTSAATTGDVTDEVAATGSVSAAETFGLSFGTAAHVAGAAASDAGTSTWTAKDVSAKVGDTVKAGDVLAVGASADLSRQISEATASWRSARIQLTIAKEQLADADSTDTTRQAQMNVYNAQNQVSQAAQTRNDLLVQSARGTLKAPIAGVVTEVNVVKGLAAPSGDAIVIESSDLQVTTDVVESDLNALKVDQAATVSISAVDATVTGKVASISPVATTDSGNSGVVSYAVTVALSDVPATVRSGMSADVTITIDSATGVLTVPAAALRGANGDYSVLVLDASGVPQTQAVQVGLVTNTAAEIKSGVAEGQQVVTGTATAQTGTNTTGGFGAPGTIPGGGGTFVGGGNFPGRGTRDGNGN